MTLRPLAAPIAISIGLIALLVACGQAPDARAGAGTDPGSRVGAEPERGILVSAAASLTDVFGEIEAAFEAAHPAVDVTLNLAGSSALRAQILEGAPVDVFASADRANMERVAEEGELAGEPMIFAWNRLQIAVPLDNPAGVRGLGDLARGDLLVGLCAEGVPCGDLAREALGRARVAAAVDTHEPDVRALLTKVELGELDAGVTYVTDVAAAVGEVEGVEIPDHWNVTAEYLIAVLARAGDFAPARAFVDFVLSSDGRAILARHGFGSS